MSKFGQIRIRWCNPTLMQYPCLYFCNCRCTRCGDTRCIRKTSAMNYSHQFLILHDWSSRRFEAHLYMFFSLITFPMMISKRPAWFPRLLWSRLVFFLTKSVLLMIYVSSDTYSLWFRWNLEVITFVIDVCFDMTWGQTWWLPLFFCCTWKRFRLLVADSDMIQSLCSYIHPQFNHAVVTHPTEFRHVRVKKLSWRNSFFQLSSTGRVEKRSTVAKLSVYVFAADLSSCESDQWCVLAPILSVIWLQ